jgi:hypothetical protein
MSKYVMVLVNTPSITKRIPREEIHTNTKKLFASFINKLSLCPRTSLSPTMWGNRQLIRFEIRQQARITSTNRTGKAYKPNDVQVNWIIKYISTGGLASLRTGSALHRGRIKTLSDFKIASSRKWDTVCSVVTFKFVETLWYCNLYSLIFASVMSAAG